MDITVNQELSNHTSDASLKLHLGFQECTPHTCGWLGGDTVNTFMPYPQHDRSARALDWRRLNKNIVEAEQACQALENPNYGWQHHPAVEMWRGHYAELVHYGVAMYREWQRRYDDGERGGNRSHKSGERLVQRYRELAPYIGDDYAPPDWLGDERLHSSHRACLLAKDGEWYGQFGWSEQPTPPGDDGRWPYWWPGGDSA